MTEQPVKIALSMICGGQKEEAANLERALASIAPGVDAIYVTLTGPRNLVKPGEKVCATFKAQVSYYPERFTAPAEEVKWLKEFFGYDPKMQAGDKLFLFDQARNFAFSQVSKDYDYILWLDADDVFVGAEKLHAIATSARDNDIGAVYFNYIYQADFTPEGKIKHVLIEHLRERLVRNNGDYKWIAPIHETLIEQRPTQKTDNYECQVVHLATQEDRERSLERNLRNLEHAIYESKGEDPRHLYYLAKAFYDLRTPEYDEKLIPLIQAYLGGKHQSGWPEERAQACDYLSEVYRRRKEYNNAIKAAMNGLIEEPENPLLFLSLAVSYCDKQDWERALFWVRLASKVRDKKSTLVKNPKDLQLRTLQIIYNASLNLSLLDEAWAAIVKLMDLVPEDPGIKEQYVFIQEVRLQRDLTQAFMQQAQELERSGEAGKIKALLQSAPRLVVSTPFYEDLYRKHMPPTVWGEKDMAIWCGPGFTTWSPKTLTRASGEFMGGSEEAVVELARAFARLGWKVTVYADPGADEGEHDGVTYLPYYKFNQADEFNVLVAWRGIGFFDQALKAKKTMLWLHDIQNALEYTEERLAKIDKVVFLSKWHRDNVPALPEDKVLLSSNGISVERTVAHQPV